MLLHALVGSFGTAYVFEHTGRDPATGGVYGLLIGGFMGWYGLVPFWGWNFLNPTRVRVRGLHRRWYLWWRWW